MAQVFNLCSGASQPRKAVPPPFDAESGLWHYRTRCYDPALGRFGQRDPAGYADGMNLYAYVRNNPLRYTDPTGLTARKVGQRQYMFDGAACRGVPE